MDSHGTQHGAARQTAAAQAYKKDTASATSTAVQSGLSAPVSGMSTPEEDTASDGPGAPEKYFRGVVYATETDTETGEVTEYRAPCTKILNPQTGTPNKPYQKRVAKHSEWLAKRRGYGKDSLFHAVVTLHREDLEEANLSPDATKSVFAQLTDRVKSRLQYRDEEAEALISQAVRPNSGEWHVHFFTLSKECTLEDVCQVFRIDGADTEVITPYSDAETDEGEEQSPADFARVTGWYLFQNRIEGAKRGDSGGFSAWTKRYADPEVDGVGYNSKAAKKNRRQHAEESARSGSGNSPEGSPEEASPTGAGSKREKQRNGTEEGEDNGGSRSSDGRNSRRSDTENTDSHGDGEETDTEEAKNTPQTGHVPPVHVPSDTVGTWRVARRLVLGSLSKRVNTEVEVEGIGRAKLTWVEVGDEGAIICYVRPLGVNKDERRVSWRRIERDGAPIVRHTNPNAMRSAETETDTEEGCPEEAKAFLENARHCRVGVRLPNGNVHEREWVDGEKKRDEEVRR